jgi:hypothetical protein
VSESTACAVEIFAAPAPARARAAKRVKRVEAEANARCPRPVIMRVVKRTGFLPNRSERLPHTGAKINCIKA